MKPTGKPPPPADEFDFCPDVVDEQGEVVREVELGGREDERVAEHRLATDPVNLE